MPCLRWASLASRHATRKSRALQGGRWSPWCHRGHMRSIAQPHAPRGVQEGDTGQLSRVTVWFWLCHWLEGYLQVASWSTAWAGTGDDPQLVPGAREQLGAACGRVRCCLPGPVVKAPAGRHKQHPAAELPTTARLCRSSALGAGRHHLPLGTAATHPAQEAAPHNHVQGPSLDSLCFYTVFQEPGGELLRASSVHRLPAGPWLEMGPRA